LKKIIIAIVLGWIMVFFLHFESFTFMENTLQDKVTTKTRPVDPRIKIVAIDSESLDKVGVFPWPSGEMANLVDRLASGGPAGVWVDTLFTDKTNEQDDQALAQVIAKHDQVYLPVYFDFQVLQKSRKEIEQEYMKLPIVGIPEERLGHINLLTDSDNVVRKMLLGVPTLDDEIMPIIGVRLANLLLPKADQIKWNQDYVWQRGREDIAVDESLQVGFSYATSPNESKFDIIPAWKVMQGEIDPIYFKDSIVMIGPFAPNLQDQFMIPEAKDPMYGVEIHANMVQAFLDNALYSPIPKSNAIIIVVLATMFGFFLFDWARAKRGAIILAILFAGCTAIVYYVYHSQGILIPYSYTLIGLVLAYIFAVAEPYIKLNRNT